jgi:hypothetical protein
MLIAAPESIAGARFYHDPLPEDQDTLKRSEAMILRVLEAELPLDDKRNELIPWELKLEAKEVWHKFHDDVESNLTKEGELRPVKDFASRAAEHAARVAGTLTIVENYNAHKISGDAMANGVTLVKWYLGEPLRLYRASRMDTRLVRAQAARNLAARHAKERP